MKNEILNFHPEILSLLKSIDQLYGYDFLEYSPASLERRIYNHIESYKLSSVPELQKSIQASKINFQNLLLDITVNVSEMFRDPTTFLAIREQIFPILKTYPHIKIWHAGCSTGEEVYSNIILLHEENLLDRCYIYATDVNPKVLIDTSEGIYAVDKLDQFEENYRLAGGTRNFRDYFTTAYKHAIIKPEFRKKIICSTHNLASDTSFGEMNLIFCRNVMIYFTSALKDRALNIFFDSLCPGGFLCIGKKESLYGRPHYNHFEEAVQKQKIYRKKYV